MSAMRFKQRAVQQCSAAAHWSIVAMLVAMFSVIAHATPAPESFPVDMPNGNVLTSASFGSHTGSSVGHGVVMDATTALLDARFPRVEKLDAGGVPVPAPNEGRVYAVIEDTLGGWVIGGDFTHVGGVELRNLAHIQADFSVNSAWRPDPNDVVRALLFHTGSEGLRLLVGGDFTQIHGTEMRSYFAVLNTASVSKPVTDINLTIDAPVRAIAAVGSMVYIGGDFTSVRGEGEFDANGDGEMDVDSNGDGVIDVDLNGDDVIDPPGPAEIDVDGDGAVDASFNTSDDPIIYTRPLTPAEDRAGIAALNFAETSNAMLVTDWYPKITGGVVKVLVAVESFGLLYVGGTFTDIVVAAETAVPKSRNGIAALNIGSNPGIVTPWNPAPTVTTGSVSVNAMVLEESTLDDNTGDDIGLLYVGGLFDEIGGQIRKNFAVLDITLAVNNAIAWDTPLDGEVYALARNDDMTYIGGAFTDKLVAMSRDDGTLVSTWQPALNGNVYALALSENALFAGGDFTTVDDGSRLYIGGEFTDVGGTPRDYIAGIDSGSGSLIPTFDVGVNANGFVRTMLLSHDGATLYVGGDFTSIGGQLRNHLAALNTTTGVALAWNPNVNGPVYDLKFSASDDLIYVAGDFSEIGGAVRHNIGAVRVDTGDEAPWDPAADGPVRAIEVSGETVYIGGDFQRINTNGQNIARSRLAALNAQVATDNAFQWGAAIDGAVRDMKLFGTTLYIAGDFQNLNDSGINRARDYVAALDTTAVAFNVLNWNPGTISGGAVTRVNTIELTGDAIFIGGDFTSVGGQVRNRLAALDFISGSPLPWWNLGVDAVVNHLDIAGSGERMVIAGNFTDTIPSAAPVGNGLATVDVRFPHVITNVAPGAYNSAQPVNMDCVDTPQDCAVSVSYTTGSGPLSNTFNPGDTALNVTGNTTYRMMAVDAAGNEGPIQTALYIIDDQAPTTVASPAGPGTGKVLNASNERLITLLCTDAGSDSTEQTAAGCAETYYTIDGKDPTTSSLLYTAPFQINEDTIVKYFSVDQADNSELNPPANDGFKTETYLVDLSAPTIAAEPPTGIFYTDGITVSLLCSDNPTVTQSSLGDIPDANNPPDPNDPPPTLTNTVNEVKRTETGCAAIYYTLDDSTPSKASRLYTGPITVSDSRVIKFIAYDFAENEGLIQRASYVRNYSDNAGAAGPLGIGLLLLPWLFRRRLRSVAGAAVSKNAKVM